MSGTVEDGGFMRGGWMHAREYVCVYIQVKSYQTKCCLVLDTDNETFLKMDL